MSDTHLTPDLAHLARLYGISLSYWDAGGTQYHLSERTLRQLLAGFGALDAVDATESAIGASVHAERVRLWHPGLPTVRVLEEEESSSVELIVPIHQLAPLCRWRIRFESGEELSESFSWDQLATIGDYHDVSGWENAHRTSIDDRELARFRLPLPHLPCGYHELSLDTEDGSGPLLQPFRRSSRLIVAPGRCHCPAIETATASDERVWGLALQLYAVQSTRNWGVGDLTDLSHAVDVSARLGANIVGINPLHALFPHAPEQASPYSPSSRLFLNPLYIDVEQIDGFNDLSARAASVDAIPGEGDLDRLRSSEFVDYSAVVAAKSPVLERLFDSFVQNHLDSNSMQASAYREFKQRLGMPLQHFARYEALRETQFRSGSETADDWRSWPETLRDCHSEAVATFAEQQRRRIEYHCWLQWVAQRQLDNVAEVARSHGMTIGLYRDLAVGVAAGGSDAWAHPALIAEDLQVGAPPDEFSTSGQNWALPPLNPRALRDSGYALFVDILRSNMRAAGALRIDHVMGLMRIFCIPAGETPAHGTYVNYPFDDLLAILALESQRHSCVVIGEDLGTVPDGLREKLHDAGVLSYRLMYFEKHYGGHLAYRKPEEYPPQALVTATTHDLPTLRGFWQGADIAVRQSLGLFPSEHFHVEQMQERTHDRDRLLEALCEESLISQEDAARYRVNDDIEPGLVIALHAYLARTPSRLLMVNMEDMLGQTAQINLPGTDRDVYPNWRRKLPIALEHWLERPMLRAVATAINEARATSADA